MSTRFETDLPSLFEFIRNGMNVKQSKDGNGLPITRIETIWNGEVDTQRFGYAGLSKLDAEKWLLRKGDILFSHINSVEHIGKCALFDGGYELVHGMNLLCFRPKLDRADPNYLKWLFRSEGFRSQIMPFVNKAVNQASISIGNLSSLRVQIPRLEEQTRIAAILDQADDLRRKRQRALDRFNQLGQAIFTEMFGDGATFERASLKTLGKVSTGSTPPTSDGESFGGSVPFITPSDLDSENPIRRTLSEHGASKSRTVSKGATLVCCIGSIGKMRKTETRSAFNQQINAIEWGPEIDADFGFFVVQSQRQVVEQMGKRAATTLPILKKSEFEKLEVFCPPLIEQREFARRIAGLRHLNSVLALSREKSEGLFWALQHSAFRGELIASSVGGSRVIKCVQS